MKEIKFEGKNDKELLAAVAMWLATELAKKRDEPVITPQGGDGGGPG
ncbi:MAG: hypothetical protein OEY21_10070 [Nitrospira sp.]|nr:hypothetical protein [Nitrospira sp.]